MSIILNMVGFDTTTQINCQVGPVLTSGPSYWLINYVHKAWMTSELVSAFFYLHKPQHPTCDNPISFSSSSVTSPLFPLRCWLYFVCMSSMRYNHPPEPRRLKKLGRIAIWNRVKIVLVLAIAIWMIDIVFAIDGKYLPMLWAYFVNLLIPQLSYGWIFAIPTALDLFGLPDNYRSALRGRQSQTPVRFSTLPTRPPNSLLSPFSLPTLCYLSSCSSVCSACAPIQAVASVWGASFWNRWGFPSRAVILPKLIKLNF